MKKSVLFLSIVVVVLAFQNCGKAGFDSSSQFDSSSNSQNSDVKVTAAPFPYEASANVIAYNSCPLASQSSNKNANFNLKIISTDATAYNSILQTMRNQGLSAPAPMVSGGIRLKSDFLTYVDKNFKGTASKASSDQIVNILQNNPDFKSARPQISIRKKSDVRHIVKNIPGSNSPAAFWQLSKLASPLVAKKIADSRDAWVNSFPKNASEPEILSVAMNYGTADTIGENEMKNLRVTLSDEFLITMGFIKNTEDSSSLVQLETFTAGVDGMNGRGYNLAFSDPRRPANLGSSLVSSSNQRAIVPGNEITEYDLASMSTIPSYWSCFSYAVVRYEDRAICPNDLYNEIQRDKLEIVRKILRPEDWSVSTKYGCVVPTSANSGNNCYKTTGAAPANESAIWTSWNQKLGFGMHYDDPPGGLNTNGGANVGIEYRYWTKNCSGVAATNGTRECVNFMTFCYKQQ